jgi:serpin B
LSILIQKAFIEVNEEGTKAAAATLAMMGSGGVIMRQRKVFCADHAFIYWIQHLPSQQMLFVGTVCNPSSTS